jgi:hypothetical protein
MTGAGHVLDNNIRVTGYVAAHMARNRPRPEIIFLPCGRSDDEADLLSAIELLRSLRPRGLSASDDKQAENIRYPFLHHYAPPKPTLIWCFENATNEIRGRPCTDGLHKAAGRRPR